MAEENPNPANPDDAAERKPATEPSSFLAQLGADTDALPLEFADPTAIPEAPPVASVATPMAVPVAVAPAASIAPRVMGLQMPPSGPPMIIDSPVRLRGAVRYLLSYALFIATMIAVMLIIMLYFGGLPFAGGVGSFGFTLAMIFVVSLVLGLFPMFQRWRARRLARRVFGDDPAAPIPDMVGRVMRRRPWFSGPTVANELAVLLAAESRTNVILRMAGRKNFWPVHPTQWAFEPRPLDESDETFLELADATAAENAENGFEFTSPDTLPLRRIRRNIRMKGGYLSLVIYILLWGDSAYDFYKIGTPDIWFAFFTYLLANKLFMSSTGGVGAAVWYLVSQGLLIDLRKSKIDMPHALVNRTLCTLSVYQITKYTWTVFVASPWAQFTNTATSREVEMLLRTWCSDVPPPKEEIVAALLSDGAASVAQPRLPAAEAGAESTNA